MEILKEIEELKNKIAELEKEIKKENSGRWKPERNDKYFYISAHAEVCDDKWEEYEGDNDRYSIGNCFRTKKGAEFAVEKLKVIAELKDYEEQDAVWDERNSHYYILFDAKDRKILTCETKLWIPQGAIFFKSEENAKKAIETVGEDRIRKYIFGR